MLSYPKERARYSQELKKCPPRYDGVYRWLLRLILGDNFFNFCSVLSDVLETQVRSAFTYKFLKLFRILKIPIISVKKYFFDWDSWKILNLSSFKRGKNASACVLKGFLLGKNHIFMLQDVKFVIFIFADEEQNLNSIFCTISKMVWLQKSIATVTRWQ